VGRWEEKEERWDRMVRKKRADEARVVKWVKEVKWEARWDPKEKMMTIWEVRWDPREKVKMVV